PFALVQLQRPLIEAVRQVRDAFLRSADAEQRVDLVVIRRDVGVSDRPVLAGAVVRLPLEIDLGEPRRHATPHVRLAASTRARTQAYGVPVVGCSFSLTTLCVE